MIKNERWKGEWLVGAIALRASQRSPQQSTKFVVDYLYMVLNTLWCVLNSCCKLNQAMLLITRLQVGRIGRVGRNIKATGQIYI